jgi:sensor histidine kinase YesM
LTSVIRHILFILFFVSFIGSKGQEGVDAWKSILRSSDVDTLRIEAYNQLAIIYSQTDLPIARKYADSALFEISLAEKQTTHLSSFYEKHKGMSYNTIAHIDYQQGKFRDAIENCLKNIRIFEKFKDTVNTSRLYGSLSQILSSIGNNKDALFYIRKAVKMDEDHYRLHKNQGEVQVDLIGSYINLTNTFLALSLYDSTLFYCNKALTLMDTSQKNMDLGLIYTNIGAAHGEQENYSLSILYTQKALEIYKSLGLPEYTSIAYSNLSELYMRTKDHKKALYYADLSEEINKANSFDDNLLNSYAIKAQIYSELNDPKNEILYLKKHAALKDSLLQQNHAIQMEELKTQYETEKKEIEIVKLSADNKIQELQLNRFVIIIISIVVVLLLLVGLAFFLIKNIRERKKAYIKLQEKNIEIQKQGEQLNEQSKLISKYQSQMNPHFVFNALNSIQGSILNDEKDKTIDRLQLLSQLMRQTLNNSESDHISLDTEINYLKTYVEFEKQKFSNGLKFEVFYPEDHEDILIPPMMIQPFIENAIKHAGLQNLKDACVTLKIAIEDNLLKITVKDNGRGFDTKDGSILKNSHALKIIQSRLQLLFMTEKESDNIRFEIRSKPELERGTEIKFYLPLNYKY